MRSRIFYIAFIAIALVSCKTTKVYHPSMSISGEYIPVMMTSQPDRELLAIVSKYEVELDKVMSEVIGYSTNHMETGRPESLLTNLTADAMMLLPTEENQKIDLAFMNVNGIRSSIAQGDITLGDIFNAYPFDNSLCVVELEGRYLSQIFQSYAEMGGAGVSGNVRLEIKDGHMQKVTVDGHPVVANKLYTIVTLDYLAEGNDGMNAMVNAKRVTQTHVMLRDYILQHIKELTNEGAKVEPKLDGRITIIK